ncbi:MAG: hypothetical protein J0I07_03410 [Myxococcales bacterium]|nr:hypothetical protein [Myxococcales bacterium]
MAIRGRQNTVWVARGLMSAPNEQPLDRFDRWTEQEPTARETFGASGATLNALAVSSPDEAWATGTCPSGHCVFRMTRQAMDGSASTWQLEELDSRSARRLFGIWGDEHVVWLVGEGGTLRRLDKGQSLERRFDFVDSPVDSDLRCVFGFSKDDVWAVGEDSTVLHWDGTSWKRLETPFDDASKGPNLYAIWGSSPEDVWIVGEGTVLHFGGNAQ